jgi:hypothetical protein
MSEMAGILNLRLKSGDWRNDVGIVRWTQLEQLEAIVIFQMLRQAAQRRSLNMSQAFPQV